MRPEALLLGDGRVLVAWHDIAPDSTPNRVFVQPFGCVDGSASTAIPAEARSALVARGRVRA